MHKEEIQDDQPEDLSTGSKRTSSPTGFQRAGSPTGSKRPSSPVGSKMASSPTGCKNASSPFSKKVNTPDQQPLLRKRKSSEDADNIAEMKKDKEDCVQVHYSLHCSKE